MVDLKAAIVKATYWFTDAQRDQERVMQFVKYWSCIEAFFSTDLTRIALHHVLQLAAPALEP